MATTKSGGQSAGTGPARSAANARGGAGARPPPLGKRGRAFASLNAVLKPHLRRSADGRKVVSHARSRIKNQSTPFSQETSAGFGWKPT